MVKVVEVQNKDVTRIYNLEGPEVETIRSFWDYLVAQGTIESFKIEE